MAEFKNPNITVIVERAPGSKAKLHIKVSPEATKAAYAQALKNINKEVSLPGFRKGKAPESLVLQKFEPHVKDEWNNIVINTSFSEALELTQIAPLSERAVSKPQVKTLSKEDGTDFTIEFESFPEVPAINPADISLKKTTPKETSDSDVEDRIYDLRLNKADWVTITDRPLQEEDFAELDIDSLDEEGFTICKDQTFLVAHDKIGSWLYNAIIGKQVGDTVEATSEKEDCKECHDHTHVHPEESEFKPTRCRITIKTIKKANMPDLDDEFAKKIGAESVELLKERVKGSLSNESKEKAQQHLRREVDKKLAERYAFEIPASLIKSQQGAAVEHRLTLLTNQGEKPNRKEIEDEVRKELEDAYRVYFICEKIAKEQQIEVTQDEIMQEFMVQAYMTRQGEGYVDPSMNAEEIRARVHSHLLNKKVKDYIVEHAQAE